MKSFISKEIRAGNAASAGGAKGRGWHPGLLEDDDFLPLQPSHNSPPTPQKGGTRKGRKRAEDGHPSACVGRPAARYKLLSSSTAATEEITYGSTSTNSYFTMFFNVLLRKSRGWTHKDSTDSFCASHKCVKKRFCRPFSFINNF